MQDTTCDTTVLFVLLVLLGVMLILLSVVVVLGVVVQLACCMHKYYIIHDFIAPARFFNVHDQIERY